MKKVAYVMLLLGLVTASLLVVAAGAQEPATVLAGPVQQGITSTVPAATVAPVAPGGGAGGGVAVTVAPAGTPATLPVTGTTPVVNVWLLVALAFLILLLILALSRRTI